MSKWYGEGTIRQRASGKWEARLRVNGVQKSFYADSERNAKKLLKDFKSKISQGVTNHKRVSYSDFLAGWLEIKKLELKPQSYDRLVRTVKCHILPRIGFYYVDCLDAETLRDEVIKAAMGALARSSVKKIYDALNGSLKYAVKKGMIVRNPMDLVSMPTAEAFDPPKDMEIFTDEEILRFVAAATSRHNNGEPRYPNGGIFLFMLNTGLRAGEACALKWQDYNAKDNTWRIHSSTIQDKDAQGKSVIRDQMSGKTRASNRVLKLNANAVAALPEKRRGKYVFCSKEGKLLRPRNLQNTLNSILARAGIEHKSTHVFRHTFASKLFEKGYDVRVVSEILGHANTATTYNTYIHLIQHQKAQAMDAIGDMY